MNNNKYKRIMLKLSGEYLMGKSDYGIDFEVLKDITKRLIKLADEGLEIIVEIGGGNIYRWRTAEKGLSREAADMMGMMGSAMNAINFQALDDSFIALSPLQMKSAIDNYTPRIAKKYLQEGKIVVIGGGLGNQYFTTDSGAAAHALQTDCDIVLKGTNVDGVYDDDPNKNSQAKKYDNVSYDEVISKNLNVMDMTAFALCRDNELPVLVFDVTKKGNLEKAIWGENVGTKISK